MGVGGRWEALRRGGRGEVGGGPGGVVVGGSTAAHGLNDLRFRRRWENLPVGSVGVVGSRRGLGPLTEFYGKEFHHSPVTKDTKVEAEARLLARSQSAPSTSRSSRPGSGTPTSSPPLASRAQTVEANSVRP